MAPDPCREARPRTWVSDSSAEASTTSGPVAATEESTWKSSVDLPMPGGPNSRVTEPATTPPPRTRSSSPTPVASGACALRRDVGQGHGRLGATRRAPGRTGAGPKVFHSPQVGQRPTQRSEVAPHAVQR